MIWVCDFCHSLWRWLPISPNSTPGCSGYGKI